MAARITPPVATVMLRPARWVGLPDTDVEVLLWGKRRDAGQDGLLIRRNGPPDRYGGWDLLPVHRQCWIRRVRQPARRPSLP